MGVLRVTVPCLLATVGILLVGCTRRPEPVERNDLPSWQEKDDRSAYMGKPVARPEEMSGVWEAPDGRGGTVGLHLVLSTTVPASATVLLGTAQSWTALEVGLYERGGPTVEFGEENWLSDSPRGGGVRYEGNRMQVSGPAFDLDLHRGPGDTWVRRFHREAFDAEVTLRRPDMAARKNAEWYLGTWMEEASTFQSCTHVGRGADGAVVAWSDHLTELGCVRYGPSVPRAKTATEIYGSLVKAHREEDGGLTMVMGAYSAGCCPLSMEGSRGPSRTMRVVWEDQLNHAAGHSVWRRMPGTSCVSAAGRAFDR